VRRFVNVFVNGEDIRFLQNMETALKEGDAISIVPAIAGGAELPRQHLWHSPIQSAAGDNTAEGSRKSNRSST